jgi:hypothetical protein
MTRALLSAFLIAAAIIIAVLSALAGVLFLAGSLS